MDIVEICDELVRLHPRPPTNGGSLHPCTMPEQCIWCKSSFGIWRDDHATDKPEGWAWRAWPHPENNCLWIRAHRTMQSSANGLPDGVTPDK